MKVPLHAFELVNLALPTMFVLKDTSRKGPFRFWAVGKPGVARGDVVRGTLYRRAVRHSIMWGNGVRMPQRMAEELYAYFLLVRRTS